MTKAELRNVYKNKRAALSEKERLRLDDLLLIKFQQLGNFYDASILMSYYPLPLHREVNTNLMTDYLRFRMPGLQIAYPVANFEDHSMNVILVNKDTEFRLNHLGIGEPVDGTQVDPLDIDLVFVPLLTFDTKGYRVGYGKGFYDRFLQNCREDIIKIGFSFFDPAEDISDISQFDVPLTIGITPNAIYEF